MKNKAATIMSILLALLGEKIIRTGEIGSSGGRAYVPEEHRVWVGAICFVVSAYYFYLILNKKDK